MDIFVHRDGEQQGPFTLEQVNAMLGNGMMAPTDFAWHEGLNGWVPLGDIQGVGFGTPGMTPQTTGVASQEQ